MMKTLVKVETFRNIINNMHMNKLKLKIMATAALLTASSGAFGAHAIPEMDMVGAFIKGVNKLYMTPQFFIPFDAPYITNGNFVSSNDTTPLAMLHFEKADGVGHGNMANSTINSNETRAQRGLYNINKLSTIVGNALNGVEDIKVNVIVQTLPIGDLFFRPEIAICPDLNAKGSLQNWSFGVFSPMLDTATADNLKKDMNLIGNNQFDNTQFNNLPNNALKIIDAATVNNKSHVSFWTVLKKEKKAFLTYHWLIKKSFADIIRKQIRIAVLASKFQGHFENFAPVYNTDTIGRSNLFALCKELSCLIPPDNASTEQLNQIWKNLVSQNTLAGLLIDRIMNGISAFSGALYHIKDDLTPGNSTGGNNIFWKHISRSKLISID